MVYYQCPECGFKQRTKAKKRVKCRRCGKSFLKKKAKKTRKKPDKEKGTGFFKYKKEDE